MQTRSKNNIFKPKILNHVTKHPLSEPIEPTSVFQALKHPEWPATMSSNFDALLRNGTWDLVHFNVN